MAKSGTNLQADILKVGYHGSATSSSSAFLSQAQPKISVIEVGAGNSYGPPTPATLGRLAQVVSGVYRTDLNGEVTVTTDGTTSRCTNGPTSGEYAEFRRSGLRLFILHRRLQGFFRA